MSKIKIGVVVGSLRKESFSKKIARSISGLMPDNFEMQFIEIGNLAMYNQDYDDEGRAPAEWEVFRSTVKGLDGLLFVTPEYNRSIPPVLKNALDIGSRPYGKNVWGGKPGAVISVSSGKLGGFGANHHFRQTAVFLNIPLMQQPEVYLSDVASLLNDRGEIKDQGTRDFLQSCVNAFTAWVNRLLAAR